MVWKRYSAFVLSLALLTGSVPAFGAEIETEGLSVMEYEDGLGEVYVETSSGGSSAEVSGLEIDDDIAGGDDVMIEAYPEIETEAYEEDTSFAAGDDMASDGILIEEITDDDALPEDTSFAEGFDEEEDSAYADFSLYADPDAKSTADPAKKFAKRGVLGTQSLILGEGSFTGLYGDQLSSGARIIYDAFVATFVTDGSVSSAQVTVGSSLTNTPVSAYGVPVNDDNTLNRSSEEYKAFMQSYAYELQSAASAFQYDHPEIMWIRDGSFPITIGKYLKGDGTADIFAQKINMKPNEAFSGAFSMQSSFLAAIPDKVQAVFAIADFDGDGKVSDLEYLLYCDLLIKDTVYYDQPAYDAVIDAQRKNNDSDPSNDVGSVNYRAFTAAPFFLSSASVSENGAVCEGYSRAFKLLLKERGIPCALVAGKTASGAGHMWCVVQMGGVWYVCDPTWDDTSSVNASATAWNDSLWRSHMLVQHGANSRVENPKFSTNASQSFTYPSQSSSAYEYEIDRVVTPSTCVAAGSADYIATAGISGMKDLDFADHSWQVVSSQDGTCIAKARTNYECGVCHATKFEEGDFGNHDWQVTENVPVTCETDGHVTKTCLVCHTTDTQTTKSTGHKWSFKSAVDATCTAPGSKTYECGVCYETKTEATNPIGHRYKNTVVAPTCTQDGYTLHSCQRCDYAYRDTPVAKLGHSYDSVVTKPTCTKDGYTTYTCSRCGDSYRGNTVSKLGHDYKATVVSPTCTKDGYTLHTCSRCGDSYTDSVTPKIRHSYQDTVIAPDCVHAGYTKRVCSVCGNTVTTNEKPAVGHKYKKIVHAPTCTQDGYTENVCEHCSDTFRSDVVKASGHDYEMAVTAPTCVKKGFTTYTCKVCSYTYTSDEVGALGHAYDAGVKIEPSCTAPGYTVHTCSWCGLKQTMSVVPALGHDYATSVVAPTTEHGGYTLHECSRCHTSYKSDEKPALKPSDNSSSGQGSSSSKPSSSKKEEKKRVNTIKASDVSRKASKKKVSFTLSASCASGSKLTFKSLTSKVKVDSSGKVTLPKKFSGVAQIKISAPASGNYLSSEKTVDIVVSPGKAKKPSAKVTKGKGKAKVSVKKVSFANGYQIQASYSKNFANTIYDKHSSKKSVKLSKLRKGSVYVRVRAYKKSAAGYAYGPWSSVKKVKIK